MREAAGSGEPMKNQMREAEHLREPVARARLRNWVKGTYPCLAVALLGLSLVACSGDQEKPQASSASDAAPGPAQTATARPDLSGVWTASTTGSGGVGGVTAGLPIEYHTAICYSCPIDIHEYVKAWLADPANDETSIEELVKMFPKAPGFNVMIPDDTLQPNIVAARKVFDGPRDDPSLKCEPVSFARLHYDDLLPIKIEQFDDRVVITHEYWERTETVHLNVGEFPKDLKPTPAGYSIGWYEGNSLVVVTTGIAAGLLTDDGTTLTDSVRVVERYTREGNVLRQTLTIFDPATFRRPAVFVKGWLFAPNMPIQPFPCEPPKS